MVIFVAAYRGGDPGSHCDYTGGIAPSSLLLGVELIVNLIRISVPFAKYRREEVFNNRGKA
jgi:hypothetical protein